jgi:type IV pilus assembly protein PilC
VSTFVYTARPERGAPIKGEVSGDSKVSVANELRRKGLTVLSVDQKKAMPSINEMLEGMTQIKLRDKVVFARQFATMINAGLALLRGLYILEEQTANPRFKKIISQIRRDVEAGMPLSDAMEKHPIAFDRLFVSMVRSSAWPLSSRRTTACGAPSNRP